MTETVDVEPIRVDLVELGLGPEDADKQRAAAKSVYRTRKRDLRSALNIVTSARTQAAAALTMLGVAIAPLGPVDIEDPPATEDEAVPEDSGPGFTESRVDEPDAVITKPRSDEGAVD